MLDHVDVITAVLIANGVPAELAGVIAVQAADGWRESHAVGFMHEIRVAVRPYLEG